MPVLLTLAFLKNSATSFSSAGPIASVAHFTARVMQAACDGQKMKMRMEIKIRGGTVRQWHFWGWKEQEGKNRKGRRRQEGVEKECVLQGCESKSGKKGSHVCERRRST